MPTISLDEIISEQMQDPKFRAAYLSEAGRLLLHGDPLGARLILNEFTKLPGAEERSLDEGASLQLCVELLVRLQESQALDLNVEGTPRMVIDQAAWPGFPTGQGEQSA